MVWVVYGYSFKAFACKHLQEKGNQFRSEGEEKKKERETMIRAQLKLGGNFGAKRKAAEYNLIGAGQEMKPERTSLRAELFVHTDDVFQIARVLMECPSSLKFEF